MATSQALPPIVIISKVRAIDLQFHTVSVTKELPDGVNHPLLDGR